MENSVPKIGVIVGIALLALGFFSVYMTYGGAGPLAYYAISMTPDKKTVAMDEPITFQGQITGEDFWRELSIRFKEPKEVPKYDWEEIFHKEVQASGVQYGYSFQKEFDVPDAKKIRVRGFDLTPSGIRIMPDFKPKRKSNIWVEGEKVQDATEYGHYSAQTVTYPGVGGDHDVFIHIKRGGVWYKFRLLSLGSNTKINYDWKDAYGGCGLPPVDVVIGCCGDGDVINEQFLSLSVDPGSNYFFDRWDVYYPTTIGTPVERRYTHYLEADYDLAPKTSGAVWFEYRRRGGSEWNTTKKTDALGPGEHEAPVSLEDGQTYEYRVCWAEYIIIDCPNPEKDGLKSTHRGQIKTAHASELESGVDTSSPDICVPTYTTPIASWWKETSREYHAYLIYTGGAEGFNLSVTSGVGGSVEVSPDKNLYDPGEEVKLTADSDEGAMFAGWSGDANGWSKTISVTMSENKSVKANFQLLDESPAEGTVVDVSNELEAGVKWSWPSDISIGSSTRGFMMVDALKESGTKTVWRDVKNYPNLLPEVGTPYYETAEDDGSYSVTFKPEQVVDEPGTYKAYAWCPQANSQYPTSEPVKIEVTEGVAKKYSLTTNVTEGSGSISVSPSRDEYSPGTEVTVTAQPDSNYDFNYWSGDISGSDSSKTFAINKDMAIEAHFKPTSEPPQRYTLNTSIEGKGSLRVEPLQNDYEEGTKVELHADPEPMWKFDHWEGDVARDSLDTHIVMDSDKSITAVFVEKDQPTLGEKIALPSPYGIIALIIGLLAILASVYVIRRR